MWGYYATDVCVLDPLAPYEVLYICPINARMTEIDRELQKPEMPASSVAQKHDLVALLGVMAGFACWALGLAFAGGGDAWICFA